MRRRAFLVVACRLLLSASAAEPQSPPRTARLGYLSLRSRSSYLDEAFRQGLRDLGYVEGQNISIEARWAGWNLDRLTALADELVRMKMDVIVCTGGNAAVLAVKGVVTTIPVVFASSDPVAAGIVKSLDRPGGNFTGVNLLTIELNTKRLELLHTTLPAVSRVAVLANPEAPRSATRLNDLETAARALAVTLRVFHARHAAEIDQAFAAMAGERVGALLVMANPIFFAELERVVRLSLKTRLPGIFEWREFAEAGGLVSYGANSGDMYRRLAVYVDKVLKGARPGDLPIEQPTKLELVVNLQTARALGVTIPPSVLLRADRVIE